MLQDNGAYTITPSFSAALNNNSSMKVDTTTWYLTCNKHAKKSRMPVTASRKKRRVRSKPI